jgi:multidrug resistance efflux pump
LQNRLAAVRAGFGDQLGAASTQISTSRQNFSNLQGQLSAYQPLLAQAQAQGNTQAVIDLTNKINDLAAQIYEANLQTQQLITAYHQLAINIMQVQTQASSGFFSAATQIAQTLGAIAGNQNLPALIAYAREAGQH